ncbi:MAG: methyltransferase [Desulfobacterales bacterium]|nr:methyltransferase [Desulfobacterales bacterium]
MEKFTAESLLDGKVCLFQPKTGYRYSIDPILLCDQIPPLDPGSRVLDIGCGCGIMPLLLGFNHPETTILGIEIQKELAELAQKNVTENAIDNRISIINKDIADVSLADIKDCVDLVISNPPYKKVNTGRLNPDPQKAIARHEVKLNIQTVFTKADELLCPGGRIMIILPAERLFDIGRALAITSICAEWIQFVHTAKDRDAKRVIFSGLKNKKSPYRVLPPLFLDTQNRAS